MGFSLLSALNIILGQCVCQVLWYKLVTLKFQPYTCVAVKTKSNVYAIKWHWDQNFIIKHVLGFIIKLKFDEDLLTF